MRTSEVTSTSFAVPLLAVALLDCAVPQSAQTARSQRAASSESNASLIARGKYIVEDVAMCGTCHTPRNDAGAIAQARWLDGAAALWLLPSRPTAGGHCKRLGSQVPRLRAMRN